MICGEQTCMPQDRDVTLVGGDRPAGTRPNLKPCTSGPAVADTRRLSVPRSVAPLVTMPVTGLFAFLGPARPGPRAVGRTVTRMLIASCKQA